MTLGDLIKKYRQNNKITMKELAEASGLSKGYISMLEKGLNPNTHEPITPTLPTLNKLAAAMNITLDDLINTLDPDTDVYVSAKPVNYLDSKAQALELNEEQVADVSKYMDFVASKGINTTQEELERIQERIRKIKNDEFE